MPSFTFSDTDDDGIVCLKSGKSSNSNTTEAADVNRKVFDSVENSAEYVAYKTVAYNTRSAKKADGVKKSTSGNGMKVGELLKGVTSDEVAAHSTKQISKRAVKSDANSGEENSTTMKSSKSGGGIDERANTAGTVSASNAAEGNSKIAPAQAFEGPKEPKIGQNQSVATAKEAESGISLATPPKSKDESIAGVLLLPSILASSSKETSAEELEDEATEPFVTADEELKEPVAQSVNQVFLMKMQMLDHSYQWSGVHTAEESGPYPSHDVHRQRIVRMLDNPGRTEDIIAMCLRNNEDIDAEEMLRQFDYFSV